MDWYLIFRITNNQGRWDLFLGKEVWKASAIVNEGEDKGLVFGVLAALVNHRDATISVWYKEGEGSYTTKYIKGTEAIQMPVN